MKNLLVIALVIVSSVAMAKGHKVSKEAKKEAIAACKSEGKKGKELKACVKEKTAMPAAEAKTAMPAAEAKTEAPAAPAAEGTK